MVIRSVEGSSAHRSILCASLLAVVIALPVAASVQNPNSPSPSPQNLGGQNPSGQNPGAQAPSPAVPNGQDPAPVEAAVVYGKVVVDGVRPRCWSSAVAAPPAFEDVLKKDQVIRLGRSENGFRQIILPLGPMGYVSKRFSNEADDGTVTTKGLKVAFRYRPRTSEAPVAQMPDGTTLHVVALEDGWYRARVAGIECWLAEAEVQVVPSDPEVVTAYQAFADASKAAMQARLDQIAVAHKQKQQDGIDMEAVKVLEAAFRKEMDKPSGEQQFEPLKGALEKAVAEVAEGGQARTALAGLKKRIETQQWIVEAMEVSTSKPPMDNKPVVKAPKDKLDRFESIGWLRYERRLAGPGVYYLEKGGRRQHLLSCNTGRFDLSLYVGREVGVIGPRRTPVADTLSVLDVERIEVLGAVRR